MPEFKQSPGYHVPFKLSEDYAYVSIYNTGSENVPYEVGLSVPNEYDFLCANVLFAWRIDRLQEATISS